MRVGVFSTIVIVSTLFVLLSPSYIHVPKQQPSDMFTAHIPFDSATISSEKEHAQSTETTLAFPSAPDVPPPVQAEVVVAPMPGEDSLVAAENTITITIRRDEYVVERPPTTYAYPPLSFDAINAQARNALVNILCTTSSGAIQPISASGVIIDPRGIVLTNAHVAQYLLFAQNPQFETSCLLRTGAPAKPAWNIELLFLPSRWIDENAVKIVDARPTGTGEHDWALLQITDSLDGKPLPATFPFTSPDTREAIAFTQDPVLVASYPAGFLGGVTAQQNLYPASSFTEIQKLFTFNDGSIDLLSLGGIIVAQSGSSGGAVVNQWNRLVGLVATASDGDTTEDRDLRAISLAHVDRSLQVHTGQSLEVLLAGNVVTFGERFRSETAPQLLQKLIDAL